MTEDLETNGKLNVDAALLAYLLPVIGPAYILALRKDDSFSRYHAIQSLTIVMALILAPVVWFLFAWLVSLLPFGGVVAAYIFALVVAVYLAVVVAWIAGIINALRARRARVPFFGRLLGT